MALTAFNNNSMMSLSQNGAWLKPSKTCKYETHLDAFSKIEI